MSNLDDTQKNQAYLDELQAKWVIGKQRGEEVPLNTEKLCLLLDDSRVSWNVLSEAEK